MVNEKIRIRLKAYEHRLLDQCEAGDNVGLLLRGTERTDVERGHVLANPGTITPHTKFK